MNAQEHVYKTCIKLQLEYCLLLTKLIKEILQAKHVITHTENLSVGKVDFKLFEPASFIDLMTAYFTSQYFKCMHSSAE